MALTKKNGGQQLAKQLKKLYGRWAGELQWIENPPKLRQRAWRGGEDFAAQAAERKARAERIREALPHITYVIQLVEPEWNPETATLVRPSRGWTKGPPHGWIEAAYEVLRRADHFVTMREIVEEVAERYDLDVSAGPAYAQAYTAVSNSLMQNYQENLVSDGAQPPGWALKSRGLVPDDVTGGGEDAR